MSDLKSSTTDVSERLYLKFCEDLRGGNPFSFARYGDGEWHSILGHDGQNCDGHVYFPDMGEALRQTLKEPLPYHYGLQSFAMNRMGDTIRAWVSLEDVDIPWVDADILHDANKRERLAQFLDALKSVNVTIVGPLYLRFLNAVRHEQFVAVPEVNAWLWYKGIRKQLFDTIDQATTDPTCVLLCCGPMAKVLVHDGFKKYGDEVFFIDVGSAFDLFVGKGSRGYIREIMEAEA